MTGLLEMTNCDTGQRDFAGMTLLAWAVRSGNGEAVELLLGRGAVDPNQLDNEGDTVLTWAAIKGHWLVVKQHLDRSDVDPDRLGGGGGVGHHFLGLRVSGTS